MSFLIGFIKSAILAFMVQHILEDCLIVQGTAYL